MCSRSAASIFLTGNDGGFDGGSLLRFILYGDWMRGVNMFAVCSVVIVFALGSLITVVCNFQGIRRRQARQGQERGHPGQMRLQGAGP